jgi:hypothetical protein
MFQITENALAILEDIVTHEKETIDEVLYLRLTMGIG